MSPTWLAESGHTAADMRGRIEDQLRRHGIPFDDITGEKIPAAVYVDDRAIRYSDNWPEVVDFILFAGGDTLD